MRTTYCGLVNEALMDRTVTLYAQPYQRSRQQFDSGAVDANGNRTAGYTMQRRTTFIATFAGDTAYAPASSVVTERASRASFSTTGP